jgi:hypothetical protein
MNNFENANPKYIRNSKNFSKSLDYHLFWGYYTTIEITALIIFITVDIGEC